VIEEGSDRLENRHVEVAVQKAVDGAPKSIQSAYNSAVTSPRPDNLYRQVLLACALPPTDEFGYFQPQGVREPMSAIMGKQYDIPSFARHLSDFIEEERGPVLDRIGTTRRFRYRFSNPLMQPYIIMRGLSEGVIDSEKLR